MNNEDTLKRVVTISCQALSEMRRFGVAPSPRNYALWYTYCADDQPELTQTMASVVESGQPFSDDLCASLHARFLAIPVCHRALDVASNSLQISLLRAMETLEAASQGANDYGRVIEAASGRLDGGAEPDDLALVLTHVVEETRRFADFNRVLEHNLVQSSREVAGIREHLEALRREGRTDPVTGLANRQVFDVALKENLLLARHDKRPLSVAIMEVDHFQDFSADHGERIGDQVLRLIGRMVSENVEGLDMVSRYGAQTFAVILPGTELALAEIAAEHIRATLATRNVVNRRTQANLGQVTLSLGIAQWQPDEQPAALMQRADNALETARRKGCNCVVTAPVPG